MCTALLSACLLLLAPVLNAQLAQPKFGVANGQPVQKYQIKYQEIRKIKVRAHKLISEKVLLQIAPNSLCGGSIIDNQHVLTAAHCVALSDPKKSVSPTDIVVKCGMTNVNDPQTQKYKVGKIFLHEEYDPSTLQNDIAILKVQKAFQFGNAVAAIERAATVTTKKNCVVSGWGYTDKERRVQDKLLSTVVTILEGQKCANAFGNFFHKGKLCAGNDNGNDACPGDSGGPLTCDNQLVGVVSSGKEKCGGSAGLGLYVDVSHHKAWIDDKIKRASLNPIKKLTHVFRSAPIQEFPYQVLLFMDSGAICGGTILSENFVLTAAHCITQGNSSAQLPARNLRVLVKLNNMREPGSQEYRLQKLIIHPKYDSVNLNNDLALLQVEQSFVFSTHVGSVQRRNRPLSPAEGDECVVSGWGNINQTNIQQQVLQFVAVEIFAKNNCSQIYGTQLENDKFCARGREKTDTCMVEKVEGDGDLFVNLMWRKLDSRVYLLPDIEDKSSVPVSDVVLKMPAHLTCCGARRTKSLYSFEGDPGGPLTCGNELAGVVSARIFCGNKSNSGIRVYTDVYKHKDWIDKYVKLVSGCTSWQRNYHLSVIIYGVMITELIYFSSL